MALKGRQPLYATESRTYQKNRTLLMVPASQAVPVIPVFPANVLTASTFGEVLPVRGQTSTLPADQGSAVIDATGYPVIGAVGHPVTDAAVPPANLAADIALAMSAAPFTGFIVNSVTGKGGIDGEQDVSDYGTDGTGSRSVTVHDVQDLVMDTDEEDSLHTDSNDIITVYDGVHSDLFEDLFQNLPTDAQYRSPGLNPSGCFGPLLLLDYMLITQNGVLRHHLWCLSTPPQCGIPTFTVGTCSNGVKIKITEVILCIRGSCRRRHLKN